MFKDLIRQKRLMRGLTLTQLAERCGVSRQTISNIEHGRVQPTWATIRELAAALDIPELKHLLESK